MSNDDREEKWDAPELMWQRPAKCLFCGEVQIAQVLLYEGAVRSKVIRMCAKHAVPQDAALPPGMREWTDEYEVALVMEG